MTLKHAITDALDKIPQGVFVISSVYEGRVNAMTAAWVSRASFTPPVITVAVGPARFTHDMIKNSGVFAVNILGTENIPTGKHFGLKTGRKTDKFAGVEYDTRVTGSPILKDCLAWLDCKVLSHVPAGDHTLFIGEVVDGEVSKDLPPLVYDRKSFFK